MINKDQCVYEYLIGDEHYSCKFCHKKITSDFYAIYKGIFAQKEKKLGVLKHKEYQPVDRKKFYMIVFHPECFQELAGNDFMFVQTNVEEPKESVDEVLKKSKTKLQALREQLYDNPPWSDSEPRY